MSFFHKKFFWATIFYWPNKFWLALISGTVPTSYAKFLNLFHLLNHFSQIFIYVYDKRNLCAKQNCLAMLFYM